MARRLDRIGIRIEPAPEEAPPLELTAAEVERLAQLEHELWCRARGGAGLDVRRARRDDATRRHPDLVPWADLAEKRREIDRVHARAIPELLAAGRAGRRA